MRKITLFFALFFVFLQMNAQTGTVLVGADDGSPNTTTGYPSPLQDYYKTGRSQFLYLASELSASGLVAGDITEIGWVATSIGTSGLEENYTISILQTSLTALTSTFESGATVVYGPADFTPTAAGSIVFPLTTPFTWDGTSNLIIEVCAGNASGSWTQNVQCSNSTLSFNGSVYYRSDTATSPCTTATGTTSTTRPLVSITGNVASCLPPTFLTYTTLASDSAVVTWTENGSATLWNIEYGPAGFTPGTGTVLTGVSNPTTIGSLTANTDYDFYVQADCGGGTVSSWSAASSFTTLCSTFTAPWLYDVETAATTTSSVIEDCWSSNPSGTTSSFRWDVDGSGSTPSSSTGPSGAYSGNNYFYTEASSGSNGDVAELVTPNVDISGLTTPVVQFYYHMYGSTMGELHVDVYDGTTWTNDVDVIVGQQQTVQSDPWLQRIVSLSGYTGVVQVRFRGIRGTDFYGDMSLDDIEFTEAPSCFTPTNLAANNVTFNSVLLSWSDSSGGVQNDYEYVIQPVGTGTPTGAGTVVTGLSVTDSSLTPTTDYEVYVRADCGGGDYSGWAGPITFTTGCAPVTAPWLYDVESAATTTSSAIDDCWSSNPSGTTSLFRWDVDGSGSTPSSLTGPSGAYSGANYFYTEASSGSTGSEAELYTPLVDINALVSPVVQFYYHMYGSTMGDLHVDVFDGTTWTNDVDVILGEQQTSDTDPWLLKIVNLSGYTGVIQVRFRAVRGTDFYGDMSLDDIEFTEAPACFPPSNFAASNVTDSQVQLDWTDPTGFQYDFEYVIQPAGTGTPTGNGTPVADFSVVDNTLSPVTTYEAYVRADCGGSYSSWVGPVTFTTACAVYSVPTLEDFTTYVPDCWEEADNGDLVAGPASFGSSSWSADGFGNNGTTGAFKYNIYTTGANDWVLSPLYDIPTTGYELKFDAAAAQYASTSAPTTAWEADDYVQVLVSTSTDNWTVLYTYDNTNVPSNTGTVNIIDLDAYAGMVVRFAYRAVEGSSNGSADIDFSIDNFEIRLSPVLPPDCATNVVATPDASCGNNPTVLSWDSVSGANGYKLTIGTTSGGNDILDNVDLGLAITYDFTGLINTTYYFTVTPYNDNGDAVGCSEVTFTTTATGCYCDSVPTSNDDLGITNVTINSTGFGTPDVTYYDHTATSVDLEQNVTASVLIDFATGYTYDTNIWIDFNDDYNFDNVTEKVYTGTSTSANPTTLDASFYLAPGATLGQHRMRIGTADSGQVPPDPCFSGSYGVTLDFTVNIIAQLSAESFESNGFMAYPNPVKDVLNLKYSTEITDVKVVNLLGQVVINKNNVDSTDVQIDMNDLSAGTYIVNVTVNDAVKTIKVVKQ
ncbi:fibronectin type III domain-containing protein [Flavobacterium sp. NRK F10]|uniref:fibronectin type III domain-containing protein n=1 Tax=Flavobacterium sp. NRK F10 TaxID=2954931 RepID=UPI002090301C|nr:fibronectin type III domain-containing protein [Flavobacterium sp. NRK F10]MCO6175772.1 fibronectin type III domain-containing protein [Flavobacterium sp. NRK F10]